MQVQELTAVVENAAALRRVRRLQPVGGPGDKIFPPTYPAVKKGEPPRHLIERRRIGGAERDCVLIDSVASQANRLEEALDAVASGGQLGLPRVLVDFAGTEAAEVGVISSLTAPHRVYDAILRDGLLDGQRFRKSAVGEALCRATVRDVCALFRYSPTALLFGAWDSTGQGGGLGAKFARAVVSEIIGVDAVHGARVGSRIDPLGIRAGVQLAENKDGDWRVLSPGEKVKAGEKIKKPSEINHGNIAPSVEDGLGVTCDHARHTWVLTCAGLRRLGFGDASPEASALGRAVLAALGLVAVLEQDRAGYALRSRCDLVLDADAPAGQRGEFEVVAADGTVSHLTLDRKGAHALYVAAVEAARGAGLGWADEPVRLTADPRLIELIARSRDLALAGKGGDDEGE